MEILALGCVYSHYIAFNGISANDIYKELNVFVPLSCVDSTKYKTTITHMYLIRRTTSVRQTKYDMKWPFGGVNAVKQST